MESEISKIKILVPFGEIIKVNEYKSKIVKILNSQPGATNILNIQEDTIYFLDENMSRMFLTKEEHDESDHEVNKGEEPSHYLKGYQHAIFQMQKQYNLRNINGPITANKTQPKKDAPKAAKVRKDTPPPPPVKETNKSASILSLESEISKIKI